MQAVWDGFSLRGGIALGMDYQYAGSASYPRFDREICEIAKLFGGVETKYLTDRRESEVEGTIGYWFGFLSGGDPKEEKFVFPKGTNPILVHWLNRPYDFLDPFKTEELWGVISQHPEVKEISFQIWDELQNLAEYGECWSIW